MKTYEAMFLLDAGNSDFEEASKPVRDVLDRAQAEVLAMKPWDERRLAYKIKGRKRGLYVLTYFKADPARIDEMQHDIQLNDKVLRAMVLSADHLSAEQIQAETPVTLANARRAAAEDELKTRSEEASADKAPADESAPTAKDADSTAPAAGDSTAPTAGDSTEPAEGPSKQEAPVESSSGQAASIENNTIDKDGPGPAEAAQGLPREDAEGPDSSPAATSDTGDGESERK